MKKKSPALFSNKYAPFSLLLLLAVLFSCGKDRGKQVSYWKINDEEYSEIAGSAVGKALSIVASHGAVRFDLSFYLGYLPGSGDWKVISVNPGQDPRYANLGFYINSVPYGVAESNSNKITASESKGKVIYTLPPTWFVNYYNPDDSVLIEGVFKEP